MRRFGRRLKSPTPWTPHRIRDLTPSLAARCFLTHLTYLFFGGLIVNGVDTRRLAEHVGASSEEVYAGLAQIAGFLLQLRIVHTINLALLPMIGLLFTSLTRRAKRRAAGVEAPPESAQARRADRLVRIVVVTVAAIATAGTLALLAIVLVSIGLS